MVDPRGEAFALYSGAFAGDSVTRGRTTVRGWGWGWVWVWVWVLCAAVCGVLGWWIFRSPIPKTADGIESAGEHAQTRGVPGPARGQITPREIDSAGQQLTLTVLDSEGEALASGGLLTVCGAVSTGGQNSDRTPALVGRGGGLGAHAPVSIGPDGTAIISACIGAPTCVRLRHPTFKPKGAWVFDAPGSYDIEVQRAEALQGIVLNATGAVVPGVRVSVVAASDSEPGALPPFRSMYAITDEGGAFSFTRIEHVPCDVCAEASGACDEESVRQLPVWADVKLLVSGGAQGFASVVVAVEETTPLEIRLDAPVGGIEGFLLGRDGSRYARARVLARADDRPDERLAALVRDDGSFVLAGIGEGTYQISFVQDGRRVGEIVSAIAGDTLEVVTDEPARGVSVRLRVLRDGIAAPGVRVFGAAFAGRETDLLGEVTAEGVVPGAYPIRITHEQKTLSRTKVDLRADGATRVIKLD